MQKWCIAFFCYSALFCFHVITLLKSVHQTGKYISTGGYCKELVLAYFLTWAGIKSLPDDFIISL